MRHFRTVFNSRLQPIVSLLSPLQGPFVPQRGSCRLPEFSCANGSSLRTMPKYIDKDVAAEIDRILMGEEQQFTLEQLMELAGLACAQALAECCPTERYGSVLVACGPGNQGGDGLVAARHLQQFGYAVSIWYPKPGKNEHYQKLLTQCTRAGVVRLADEAEVAKEVEHHDVVLDAIFGFSFRGEPREPFSTALEAFKVTKKPIVSVDIPSGWDVNDGNPDGKFFSPAVLVSLTAPKLGASQFKGRHFLGGRFVPPPVAKQFGLNVGIYSGYNQIVDITHM